MLFLLVLGVSKLSMPSIELSLSEWDDIGKQEYLQQHQLLAAFEIDEIAFCHIGVAGGGPVNRSALANGCSGKYKQIVSVDDVIT